MDVVDALSARQGTICVVGAGGKKTTMATLAERLDGAVVTATVRIPLFDSWVERVVVTDDPVDAIETAKERPLGVVPSRERPDRYRGYDPAIVDRFADVDAPVIVKADGARMREFKSPDDREPQLPSTATTVIPVASVHVVGEPLDEERVHRVDRVAELTGLEPGEVIETADVATVIASEDGGLKDVPQGATVVPLLNKVDDAALAATARQVADEILDSADVPRAVLAEMRSEDPLVDVVER